MNFHNFPTTRYQGSKRKILPWIYDIVKELEFETVLDAFGGTASVSYLFKKMNKSVTFNDMLRFNYLVGKAIIENQKVNVTEEDLQRLTSIANDVIYSTFIQENFRGVYYLDKENKWLDRVTSNISQMNHYPERFLQYKKAISFYALFQACLIKRPFNLFHRKNLSIRTRNVERDFGNKTTWEKPFQDCFQRFVKEANKLVFDSGKPCRSINNSILDLDELEYDLVYFDPPYFRKSSTNETSDYLKCYHFLEGLSRYAEWSSFVNYESINLRFKPEYCLVDLKPENMRETIENLFSKFRKSIIIVSYKYGGIPSIEYIRKLLKKFKNNVYTRSKHYKYALNHQNGDAVKNREFLIIGT